MSQNAVAEALRLLQQAHEDADRQRQETRPGLSAFRWACGIVCTAIAIIFLIVNSVMLYQFAERMGHNQSEKIGQAVVAATIPWVLALLPFILMSTWVPSRVVMTRRGRYRRKRGRPSFATVSAASLYIVFVAFNFIGGIGVMAVARQSIQGKAQQAGGDLGRLNDRRTDLLKQLDSIAKYRPVDEVQALLSRQQQHRLWTLTDQCAKTGDAIKTRAQRNFCADYDLLTAELGRGKRGDQIRAQINDVDVDLSNPARSEVMADDAQAQVLASLTSMDERQVRLMLPLMWPLLLELGSMLMAYFALKFFRIDHTTLIDMPTGAQFVPPSHQLPSPSSRQAPAGAGQRQGQPEPITLTAVSVDPPSEDPIRQRAVFDQFWQQRVRSSPGSTVPEANFYTHYQTMSAAYNVAPFDLETFRRMSSSHLQGKVVEMAGIKFWSNLVPTDA